MWSLNTISFITQLQELLKPDLCIVGIDYIEENCLRGKLKGIDSFGKFCEIEFLEMVASR